METNLIQVKENETVTTSLLVAEKFKKNHRDVLRKIESLISEIETGAILRSLNFYEKTTYIDAHNESRPMYYINRDGFSLLVMGFTGKEALTWKLKYIEAFNEMEKRIAPSALADNRLELAKMILGASDKKLPFLRGLYPEYFSDEPTPGSLEYFADRYTSYKEWLDTYELDATYIMLHPAKHVYNSYLIYCQNQNIPAMGKKTFYKTVEEDFQLTKRQKGDGDRYFVYA